MLSTKGKVIELNEKGFVIENGSRIETKNSGMELDLAVGEEVSITGISLVSGSIFPATISVYRSGQQIKVEDKPRSLADKFTNKGRESESGMRSNPFESINSIPVSVDHSKSGGTSIRTFERFSDGSRGIIVADVFPRQPKPKVFLIKVVFCISVLSVLIAVMVFWLIYR